MRSLVRALWISPLHVGAAVMRKPRMFGWAALALARLPGAYRKRQSVHGPW
jgi:hypothetical protein